MTPTTTSILAQGKVEINQADRKISADEVEVNETTKIAVLKGNVVMVLGEDIFTGKEGRFNLATRAASCTAPGFS